MLSKLIEQTFNWTIMASILRNINHFVKGIVFYCALIITLLRI